VSERGGSCPCGRRMSLAAGGTRWDGCNRHLLLVRCSRGWFLHSPVARRQVRVFPGVWRLRRETWSFQTGEIVIDSLPYDKQPTFAFKRMQRGDADGFDVVVENADGRRLTHIDVSVTCDGRTRHAGVTGGEGYKIDCASAPTVVSLGLRMYGLAPQAINVADRAGADKVYIFEFDPGDLGRKKFVAHRLRMKTGDVLETIYADTPIKELEGRPFEYIRSR
jgi:hypothetical protein